MTPGRRSFLRAALFATTVPAGAMARPAPARAGDVYPEETLVIDGRRRRYRLVTPASAGAGAPLMIALHGMGIDSTWLMPRYSGLDEMARTHGSVLAYPAAADYHWPLTVGPKLDRDLKFIDTLMADLQRRFGTDPRRIYVLGMSNGGYFAVVIAARRSELLAGLAVHSGSAGALGAGFTTVRKFPVFVAHGVNDRIIPLRHGRVVADLFERQGHPAEFAAFPGLGHIWARHLGVNELIWSFWDRHRG